MTITPKLLRRLARLHGIQTAYIDMAGRRKEASPDVLIAVLECLGIDARMPKAIKPAVDPVIVAWDGKATKLRVRAKTSSSQIVLVLENGERKELDASRGARELRLPKVPFGYHKLFVEAKGCRSESLLISAPTRSYSDPDFDHAWGIFAPLYAVHSKQSWGAGNFSDWRTLIDWVGSLGGRVVATLPLLAAFLDAPACEPSPYSPASRFFWNEFYIDIEQIPEVSQTPEARKLLQSPAFRAQVEKFTASELIDYKAEAKFRRQVLEILAKQFFRNPNSRRHEDFRRFAKQNPHLESYSRFLARCEKTGSSWRSWPDCDLQPGDYDETNKDYHAFAQWIAQQQIDSLLDRCRSKGMKFYLDLPLGVHSDSYDVWRERETFAQCASVGAPPDPYFTKGQNWGFAPLNPQRLRETKYRYFIDYIRFQMRHTGLLRIDHVMGLHRLYWIPQGRPASEGAYVTYRAEELYAILCLESHRNKTILAGENLGTVPPEVNKSMARHDLRQTYVLQYEANPESLRKPPAKSVASLNTHDMPPFAAFLQGLDVEDRYKLGLIKKRDLPRERMSRKKLVAALQRLVGRGRPRLRSEASAAQAGGPSLSPEEILAASLEWLARSPSEILLINLEDLWLETVPQNVPGTSTERPNWRRKVRYGVEKIAANTGIHNMLVEFMAARKR